MKSVLWIGIAIMLGLSSGPAFAQWGPLASKVIDFGSLPPDRFPEGGWQPSGWVDPGGWTIVDVTTAGILPGAADAAPQLMELTNNTTGPTIFYFPPGTYTFVSKVDINDDNIIIRGAGADQTQFFLDGPSQQGIRFMGWTESPIAVTNDVPAGAQILSLASTSDLAVGDVVEISQEIPYWEADWGKRSWGQIVLITAISGNQITVDMPLSLGLSVSEIAEVKKLNTVNNVGIEDVYIERKQYHEASNVEMRTVYNGFMRNVESYNAVKFHFLVYRSRQVEISGNYAHDAQNYGTGGHGYGINLENLSTDILVTNNILKNLRHHILVQTGTNHSVISYNYNVDIKELVDLSLHGHFSNHNLYESNIVWWVGFADFWGQVGPENTLFRSQVNGKTDNGQGVIVYDNSDRQNIIANDFLRSSSLDRDSDVDETLEEGNVIDGTPIWNTLSSSATVPASLYLDAAPSFWPQDLPWPAFGPDVSGSALNQIPAQLRYEDLIGGGGGPGDDNEKPDASIISPLSGTNFAAGTDVLIEAEASDADGAVSKVDFYVSGIWQSTDVTAPYTFEWADVLEGAYVLTVHATDNEGATTVSKEVNVSVTREDPGGVFITSVLASSSREDATPENTLDDNLFTRWAGHGDGAWIQYNFSGMASLASIGVAWHRGDSRTAYFDLSVSEDGENWTDVLLNGESSGLTKALEYYDIAPSEVKHVRITGHGTSSNEWNIISEVALSVEAQEAFATGDASGNGTISALDAALILQHTVGQSDLVGEGAVAGDVSGNGTLSALDASLILQFVTGVIDCFPADGNCTIPGGFQGPEASFKPPRIAHWP